MRFPYGLPEKFARVSIDKEDLSFDSIGNDTDLVAYVNSQRSVGVPTTVIIDEVQEIERWERAVASLHGRNTTRVVVSGSNATMLSGELATRLAGRYVTLRVLPLSFGEFRELYARTRPSPAGRPDPDQQLFSLYRAIGGLPGILHTDLSAPLVNQMQRDIFNTIALRDIIGRHHLRDVDTFQAIVTVLNYLSYLCDAYVFDRVGRYDIRGKRYLEINAKYYVGDLGLRSGILGSGDRWISGDLENLASLELVRRGYTPAVGVFGDKEIDFVAERGGTAVAESF